MDADRPTPPQPQPSPLGEMVALYRSKIERGEEVDCAEMLDQLSRLTSQEPVGRDTSLDVSPQATLEFRPDDEPPNAAEIGEAGDPSSIVNLPGYEILEEIARGGMGVVFKARQRSLNRVVAVKMILAGQLAGEAEIGRFRAEAEAAAHLRHRNIVAIHEVGRTGPGGRQQFFSMDFVEGESLAQMVRENPLGPARAAGYVATIARAIQYAHEQGILHRDLKPANILVDGDDEPQVTDFGLAKRIEGDSNLTASGTILGTPSYMSPEQAAGQSDVDVTCDVYSLGAILYELLTGHPPFRAENPVDTLLQVLHDEPVPPQRLAPKTPRDLNTICLTCLNKDPRKRYATAAELAEDLDRFLSGEPIRARPVGLMELAMKWSRRRPALAALIAVSVLAVVGLLGGGAWYNAQLQNALGEATTQKQRAEESGDLARDRLRTTRRVLYANQVRRANDYIHNNWPNIRQAVNLLRAQIPGANEAGDDETEDLRGFDWHYLWRWCHAARAEIHTLVVELAYLPDGKLLVIGDNKLQWYEDGRLVGYAKIEHPGRGAMIRAAVSPNRQHVALAWQQGDLGLIDLSRPKQVTVFPSGHKNVITALALWNDAGKLASADMGGRVKLWDAETRTALGEFTGHSGWVRRLAFSPDGKTLASCGDDRHATLYDVDPPSQRQKRIRHLAAIIDVAFPPGGEQIMTADVRGVTYLRRLKDFSVARSFDLGRIAGRPSCLVFSPRGDWFAVGTHNRYVAVFDTARSRRRMYRGHHKDIARLAASEDGKHLASASYGNEIKTWNPLVDPAYEAADDAPANARCVSYSPSNENLVAYGGEFDGAGEVVVADRVTGKVRFRRKNSPAAFCEFSPSGTLLLSGVARAVDERLPGHVDVWDADGARVATVRVEGARILHALFVDESTLVLGCEDGRILLWDLESAAVVKTLEGHTEEAAKLALFPSRRMLVSRGMDSTVRVWDLPSGALLHTTSGVVLSHGLAVSPRGDTFARAARNPFFGESSEMKPANADPMDNKERHVEVVDAKDFHVVHTLSGHTDNIRCLAYTPDGRRLATGGVDATVKIWDLSTGLELITLSSGTGYALLDLAFSSDGRELTTVSAAGVVRVWKTSGYEATKD